MFGFIKNLIAGILGFVVGIVSNKKKGNTEIAPAKKKANTELSPAKKKGSGYFLELDEAKSISPVATVKEAAKEVASNAKKAADTVATETKKAAGSVVTETKKAAGSVATETKKAADTLTPDAPSNGAKATPSKAKTKAAKTSKSDAKQENSEVYTNGKVKEAESTIDLAAAAKKAANEVAKIPTETTFAPKYLSPSATSSNGRRRPGANMTSFLDMARQVKTPG